MNIELLFPKNIIEITKDLLKKGSEPQYSWFPMI